ncbi:hypothetical protein ACS0TY_015924 [Phlomoides rotata]
MMTPAKASPCCVDFDGGRVVASNDGILTEILLLLPVNTLIRFQLVCKFWLSLISSDLFRRLHSLLHRHKPPPPFLILTTRTLRRPIFLGELFYKNPVIKTSENLILMHSDIDFIKHFKILSCSNGLMLLRSYDDVDVDVDDDDDVDVDDVDDDDDDDVDVDDDDDVVDDYYVYNPTTKQSRKLSLPHNHKVHVSLHLLFDPTKSPHYKIVCIRDEGDELLHIEVFNSESGTWTVCVEPFTSREIMDSAACVQYKNFIFFIISGPTLFGTSVYCFDVVKNVSQSFPRPLPMVPERFEAYACCFDVYVCSCSFQESNGCLYYCAIFRFRDPYLVTFAALWKLQVNEDDPRRSEWLPMYPGFHRIHHMEGMSQLDVLTFIAETNTMLVRVSEEMVGYNFQDERYKELLDLRTYRLDSVEAHQFGETLAPL